MARLVGRGIDTGSYRSVSAPEKDGASIVWRQVREATDPRGGRHQFLRQFVEVDGQEVELAGSEVGIHSDASGKPRAILGRQFERVTVGNKAAIRASGHIVEKKMQPAGTGVEQSSDWLLHEDGGKNEPDGSSGYARGAYDDGPGHTWTGPWGYVSAPINDVVHKDDDDLITDAHVRGGMLSVVLRLMSEGGMNDICARRTLEGCTSPMPGIGLSKAGPIMFDAIQYYMPSSASWTDLPTYVSQAAFDLYETCSVEPIGGWAPTEQTAVLRAFYAIGYYRQTPATRCP